MASDTLSLVFSALADPTRRAILARLAAGTASVTELAAPFAMSLPAVSKHLKVLERAGLIARGREAQWRPCRLEAAPLREAAGWLAAYRQMWDESLERLDAYLADVQPAEPASADTRHTNTRHTNTRHTDTQHADTLRTDTQQKEQQDAIG
jgi:DNA-binding transcriptional ArsR family regulator